MVLFHIVLIGSFVVVILAMGHFVWERSYLILEQMEIKDNVVRTSLAWQSEIDVLASLVGDWAPWDDIYSFAQNPGDKQFVEKNLPDAAMANLKVNVAVVADPEGRVLFAKAIDLNNKAEILVPQSVLERINGLCRLQAFQAAPADQSISGFVMLPEFPAFIAMQRILTSERQGPSPGVLFFLKFVDDAVLKELSKRTQVSLGFHSGQIIKADREAKDYQEVITEEIIKAYYPLRDIYGADGYYILNTIPRYIYRQGQDVKKSFLALAALFTCLFIGVTFFMINRIVLSRLGKLNDFLNAVSTDNNYSVSLELPGNDELSKVATTLNRLLGHIENSNEEILALLSEVQRELEKRQQIELELKYLSLHDSLTGLYNRTYFEQTIEQLAGRHVKGLGIVCCDVDGLKIINDTMGHPIGDNMLIRTAGLLTEVFSKEGCVVARTGGDEFTVLLTDENEGYIQNACEYIRDYLEFTEPIVKGIRLKLSIGFKYIGQCVLSRDIIEGLLKEADDLMYRQKLSSSQSNRKAIVQGMMEMLKVRDYITEGHSHRIQEHVVQLADSIGLKAQQYADLCLLAQFHDIGKVGIADSILFKPGKLTAEERKEIERHSEIGHRIAQSIPELLPIADFILKHHEWWDGTGYPLGLKGEEIPVENRILAIADAYDAMTSERPYRSALSPAAALEEIKRFAGIQFDPVLANIFISIVSEKAS